MSEKTLKQIDEWKKRLIDLTKRNPLIYFKPSRKNLLEISTPSLNRIYQLLSNENELEIWLPPEEPEDNEELSKQLALQENEATWTKTCTDNLPPNEEDIVFTLDNRKEIACRLKSIYRKALSEYQEKGFRPSAIVAGLMAWQETEHTTIEKVFSPVLIYPIEIVSATPKKPYRIKESDDEVVLNPALRVKIESIFHTKLPEFGPDNIQNLDELFSNIEDLGSREGWKVERRAFIGNFTFHKMAMYQDLENYAEQIAKHRIISGLAEGYITDKTPPKTIPGERDLDNEKSPARMLYILDADSSQSRAIETAIRGHSFVLKGPPGTGKSQTISNIIAEFLEKGKSVLFVSEKMAALEVVFQRLKQARLDDFCLELHSHKANKKAVVQELLRCIEEQPVCAQNVNRSELERLASLRKKLNDYVLELHLEREPLGESLYKTFEKLSRLNGLPLFAFNLQRDEYYSPAFLNRLEDLVNRLRSDYIVLQEGDKFPWRGFRRGRFSPELKKELEQSFSALECCAARLLATSLDCSVQIGVESPKTLEGCLWLIKIAKLLNSNPRPDRTWLRDCNIDELIVETQKYYNLSVQYSLVRQEIGTKFSEDIYALPPEYNVYVTKSWDNLVPFLNDKEGGDAFNKRDRLRLLLSEARRTLEAIDRDTKIAGDHIGIGICAPYNANRARQLCEIAVLLLSDAKPEKKWLDLAVQQRLDKCIDKLKVYSLRYHKITEELTSKYDLTILNVDCERLIEEYSTRYKTIIKYLLPGYYSDNRRFKGLCKSASIPASLVEDLKQVREVKTILQNLNEESDEYKDILGAYYEGVETDLDRLVKASEMAKRILQLAGEYPIPAIVADLASNNKIVHPELLHITDRLKTALLRWSELSKEFEEIFDIENSSNARLSINELSLDEAESLVVKIANLFHEFDIAIDQLAKCKNDNDLRDFQFVNSVLEKVADVKNYESQLKAEHTRLKNTFGLRFNGTSTNWEDIVNALAWTKDFLSITGDVNLNDEFYNVLVNGIKLEPETIEEFSQQHFALRECIRKVENYFDNNSNLFSPVRIEELTLQEIVDQSKELLTRINELKIWFDFATTYTELTSANCEDFLKEVAVYLPNPDDLIGILHKAFYSSWVNRICDRAAVIGEFRGADHEGVIAEFRALDKKLNRLSSILIINELNARKPNVINIDGGEVSVLRTEGAKKRKHLPLRILFEKISNLLPKIKPCLLMSPLSVSHYLDLKQYSFDVVIFDEASQICSEDAVGAIARGQQLIVAGDNKQLPPTKFFENGDSDDDILDELQDQSLAVYQSVLDDCERIGLTPAPLMLKWHYRSKHESLIAYSNKWFYRNLVTFPCSKDLCDDLGVKHIFVEEGVYDRGGKRDNVKEAEKVADLVIDHFRKYGDRKTLGVVALSIAQRDAIEDAIEIKRKDTPELDGFFVDDRLSGFFVKNLEAVQGDERDVIMLSLGYGKDQHGRFSMNFGPINKDGGERRLNVVVTRAKEKLVLVSSVRASDFDLNSLNSDGARHLYHYLDYAERGKDALELTSVNDGEVESPFEEDVKGVICQMGYGVVSQVGCSSFRIDLGVFDHANPGRFVLGIECDGRTYHSAFTARERDRIRQEILESLGWKIHRIWSPDWFNNRDIEIERLKNAIENARTGVMPKKSTINDYGIDIRYTKKQIKDIKDAELEDKVYYQPFRLNKHYSSYEFNLPETLERRVAYLKEIVQVESPIHVDLARRRLLEIWNVKKLGSNIEANLEKTIRLGSLRSYFFKKGEFFWSNSSFTTKHVRIPKADCSETTRPVEFVCYEEIQNAMLMIIKNALGIEKKELFRETAKLFEWRMCSGVDVKFGSALKRLVDDDKVLISQEKVTLAN